MILDALREVAAALAREQVDYVLIGGAALNVHGIIRATEDIDMMVNPEPENVERLRRALRSIWSDPAIEEITAEDLGGDYPAVRYGPPQGDLYLDIVARFGTAFDYSDLQVQEVDIAGQPIRVATPETLYRMKKDTVRPIDHADASMLRERFGLDKE